jgi:hypothetical protein
VLLEFYQPGEDWRPEAAGWQSVQVEQRYPPRANGFASCRTPCCRYAGGGARFASGFGRCMGVVGDRPSAVTLPVLISVISGAAKSLDYVKGYRRLQTRRMELVGRESGRVLQVSSVDDGVDAYQVATNLGRARSPSGSRYVVVSASRESWARHADGLRQRTEDFPAPALSEDADDILHSVVVARIKRRDAPNAGAGLEPIGAPVTAVALAS